MTAEQIVQDVRTGARIVTRAPALTLTATLLIGLVVGANTTIFSLVHSLVTEGAAGVSPERLVSIGLLGRPGAGYVSYPDYRDYAAQTTTLASTAAFTEDRVTLTTPDGTYGVNATIVSPGYFQTLGVKPAIGRTIGEERTLVAMISDDIWRNYFHGDPTIVGHAVAINGAPAVIAGVAPPRFRGAQLAEAADMWVPIGPYSATAQLSARFTGRVPLIEDRANATVMMMGRLKPRITIPQAQSDLTTISRRLSNAYPDVKRTQPVVWQYSATAGGVVQAIAPAFLAIFSIVTLITLIVVCSNVANLMLARALQRQPEIAVRQALGASRRRIVQLIAAEGLAIATLSWAAACLFAWWTTRVLPRLIPAGQQNPAEVLDFTPDWRVLGYAMALALVAVAMFTLAPAARTWKTDVLTSLKTGGHTATQGRSRLSIALLVLQVSFAVVLLTSAGLATRSMSLMQVDLGFRTDHLLLVAVNTSGAASSRESHLVLTDRLRERLLALPGVQTVSYVRVPPPFSWSHDTVQAQGSTQSAQADIHLVGPDYLQTLGLTTAAGRALTQDDRDRSNGVAMVNRNLASALWPGRSPVGQTLRFASGQSVQVVGLTPNAYVAGFNPERPDPKPNLLFLVEQPVFRTGGRGIAGAAGGVTFYIRYAGALEPVAGAVGSAIRDVDSRVALLNERTMDMQLEGVTATARVIASLLAVFSAISLLIAAIGQYAVMAFDVRRRARDLGVRIALGASRRQILGSVLRQGAVVTMSGLTIGVGISIAIAFALRRVLFGVTPTDVPTYASVFAVLATISLLASYVPAQRAASTDPIRILREE